MTYDWREDSFKSWIYALHMMRLRMGLRRFESVAEMYMVECWGDIP